MKTFAKYLCLLAALFAVACDSPTEPNEPNKPNTPADPNAVVMSDIEIDDILDIAVYFLVTVRNMDSFGYIAVPKADYKESEITVDYVINNSLQYVLDDGNYSWESEMPIAVVFDTTPSTEYVIVAAAKNSTSSVIKTKTITTDKQGMIVNKLSFKPTKYAVTHDGNDHYLTMSSALYELRIHLVSEGFGGYYINATEQAEDDDTISSNKKDDGDFVAEGSYFKAIGDNVIYDKLDTGVGNVDLHYRAVTGLWEIYGTFIFMDEAAGNDAWLSIEFEAPEGKKIEGAESSEPHLFNIDITTAAATKSAEDANVWTLSLKQDKFNTFDFVLNIGGDYDYIPSGTYTTEITSYEICLDNVLVGLNTDYTNKIVIDYNAETEQSTISFDLMVKAGTAVAKAENAGPFYLHKEVVTQTETYDEGLNNGMAVWSSWDESGFWNLYCLGRYFNMDLYFMSGTDAAEHLTAGRYFLRSTAPADGSLWVDCSKSWVLRLDTDNASPLSLVCDSEDAYIDVTAEWDAEDEFWRHDIVGTLKTANGAYIINLNYPKTNGTIY